jgi:hypothetical protein
MTMAGAKTYAREKFETERKRAAFFAFLPAAGVGIIASDTWVSPWLGVPGGLLIGGVAYGLVWVYETYMWRKHQGRPPNGGSR